MSSPVEYSVTPDLIGTTLRINARGNENGNQNFYQGTQTFNDLKNQSSFFNRYSNINKATEGLQELMKNGQAGVAQDGYNRYLQIFPPSTRNPILIPLKQVSGTPTYLTGNWAQSQRCTCTCTCTCPNQPSGTNYSLRNSNMSSRGSAPDRQIMRRIPKPNPSPVNQVYYTKAPQYNERNSDILNQIAQYERASYTSPEGPSLNQNAFTITDPDSNRVRVLTNASGEVDHLLSEIDSLKQENESLRKNLRNSMPRVENADAEETIRNSLVFDTPQDLQLIEEKLGGGENSLQFSLAYRASSDGDKAETFHKKCDDISNSLVVLKTKDGKRFGGYTKQSWGGDNEYKKDDEAFVFSIDKNQIYPVTEDQNAIWCYENCGPIFEGYQIDVGDNFLNGEPCKTGFAGIGYETTEDFELNDGDEKFVIEDMEVYEVKQK